MKNNKDIINEINSLPIEQQAEAYKSINPEAWLLEQKIKQGYENIKQIKIEYENN